MILMSEVPLYFTGQPSISVPALPENHPNENSNQTGLSSGNPLTSSGRLNLMETG